MDHLRKRLGRDEGFTLIELLIVIVIIGILLAIAVPSYLGFKDRANNRAAESDLREAIPSAEAFYSDNGTYSGMKFTSLQNIDSGISTAVGVASAAPTSYCLTATIGGKIWSVKGPGATWFKTVDCSGSAQSP